MLGLPLKGLALWVFGCHLPRWTDTHVAKSTRWQLSAAAEPDGILQSGAKCPGREGTPHGSCRASTGATPTGEGPHLQPGTGVFCSQEAQAHLAALDMLTCPHHPGSVRWW